MKNSDLTRVAIVLSLLIVSAQFSVSIGSIAISLQSLVILVIGLVLTKKQGLMVTFLYLIAGLIGLPVFAQSMGGPHSVFLPSFGFILSFIPAVWAMASLQERKIKSAMQGYLQVVLLGNLIIYSLGISYMSFILNIHLELEMSFWQIITAGLLPFIPLDIIKSLIAVRIAKQLNKQLPS